MAPTAEVVDLSQDAKTFEQIVKDDIKKLPVYTPAPGGEKNNRVNQDWYAAVIIRTTDNSDLERIEIDAAAELLRGIDKICYNPEVNPRTAMLLLLGGKFIPETNSELIKRFEKQITGSVERVVRAVKGEEARKLEFIYFNYNKDHSTTPEEFAESMDKMLEYL